METFATYRDRTDLRLEELLAAANALLPEFAPEQPHGKTNERLDERTVRYYQSEGVVDRPTGYSGTAALYTYRHLLQLLTIKRLQSQGLPLRAIRGLVQSHSEAELEALLGAGEPHASASAALAPAGDAGNYLRGLLMRKAARVPAPPSPPMPAAPMAPPPPPVASEAPLLGPRARMSRAEPPPAATWQRVTVEEGLELHVSEDFSPPPSPEGRRQLAERLVALLDRLAPKGRKHQ
jgi:DNA-binding transcriptional MerR regulator